MRTTINVTQDDIDNGIALDCERCPVARAIQRALPGRHIAVGVDDIVIDGVVVECAWGVMAWSRAFDHGTKLHPFTFSLEVPEVLAAVKESPCP